MCKKFISFYLLCIISIYYIFTYFIHTYIICLYYCYGTVAPSSNLTWHLTRYVRTCDTSFPRSTIAYSSFPHFADDHPRLPPPLRNPFCLLRSVQFVVRRRRGKCRVRRLILVSRSSKSRVMRAL